jgi:TonB family protein
MRTLLRKNCLSTIRRTSSSGLHGVALVLIVFLLASTLPRASSAQDSASALARPVQDQLDALASRIADQIRNSKIDPALPKILVIDFSNVRDNQFSKLGTLLADDLAQSLSRFSAGFEVQDRKSFEAYLKDNWMGLDDLQSEGVCLTLARSMGGSGVVRGTLENEANQQLKISLSLEGIGPAWSAELQVPLTAALQELWKLPAVSYARPPEAIPVEAGILRPGTQGVALPVCVYCPSPDYTDLARAAKYRGTVELSLIVTKNGVVDSVQVLRGAPFSLTQQAIEAVQKWKFKPGKFYKQSVAIRVPVDIEFQLY